MNSEAEDWIEFDGNPTPTEAAAEPALEDSPPNPEPNVPPEEPKAETPPAETPPEETPPQEPAPPPKVEFTPEQQEKVNKMQAEKALKVREEARAREEAEKRASEAEARLRELQAPVRPDIPPPPNSYDPDYEQRMQARDVAIQRAAAYDAQQMELQRQAQFNHEEGLRKQAEKMKEVEDTFVANGEKVGVSRGDLDLASQKVHEAGLSPEVGMHLAGDPKGALVVKYLSENPIELERVVSMSPLQAAAYIESTVKDRSMPKEPDPGLDPVPTVAGASMPEQERGVPGTTYE